MQVRNNVLPLNLAKDVELAPCTKTLVMCNGTKVNHMGSCILPVINPKNKWKVSSEISGRRRELDTVVGFEYGTKNEIVNGSQRKLCHCCGGNRTYHLWNTSSMLFQLSYAVR